MTRKRRIPVAAPLLNGNEKKYVMDCLESTWISSIGEYIDRFEAAFAGFCGVNHGIACCNGTAALHVALLAAGVGPGDEVIVPTLTFVATANAVAYCGARPVFVDSEPETWNLDPQQIEERITPRTRAIIAVHLYGHPADMDPILEIAQRHGLVVIEDAAEAHGATYKERRAGSIGHLAAFSFYGNKIITTGEGGMVTTQDTALAKKVRLLRGQGMAPERRYWFPIQGYNYRMTNIAAAIGLAQLENADWHLGRRRAIAAAYRQRLEGISGIVMQREKPWAHNAYWMSNIVLPDTCPMTRDGLMRELEQAGIETRPFFHPLHDLPMYREPAQGGGFPVATRLGANGLSLPSFPALKSEDIDHICDTICGILESDGSLEENSGN